MQAILWDTGEFLDYPHFKDMKYTIFLLTFFTPQVIYASINNSFELISAIYSVIASLIPIVAGIVLIIFFWGLGRFVYNAGEEKGHEEGKRIMFWGLVAIFVLFSIWGIISYIGSNLGIVGNGSFGGTGNAVNFSSGIFGRAGSGGGGARGGGSFTPGGGLDSDGNCQNYRDSSLRWSDFLGNHETCY